MIKLTQEQLEDLLMEENVEFKRLQTRSEVKEKAEQWGKEEKKYSLFTLIYEEEWFYLEGIRWANAIEYVIIEGEYELID